MKIQIITNQTYKLKMTKYKITLYKNSVRFMIHRDDTWLLWAVGQLKICSSVADGKGIGLLVHNFIDDHHNAHNAKLVMSKMHLCCY